MTTRDSPQWSVVDHWGLSLVVIARQCDIQKVKEKAVTRYLGNSFSF